MIHWEKLYELKKSNRETGLYFEQLVLEYLQSNYPRYKWKNTQPSWDENHDFVSCVIDNIWAESKYRKNSTSLRRQDLDPSIVSGSIDGKIRTIIFITNGEVPDNLINRLHNFGKIHGIKMICIMRVQLEYWLALNRDVYHRYFEEEFSFDLVPIDVAMIQYAYIGDPFFPQDNLFRPSQQLYLDKQYNLCITLQILAPVLFVLIDDNYPFVLNGDSSLYLSSGMHSITLHLQTSRLYDGTLELIYEINGQRFVYLMDIQITEDKSVFLIHTHQNSLVKNIKNYILNTSYPIGSVLNIVGNKNTGKSVAASLIFEHFFSKRPSVFFSFQEENDANNAVIICRIIIFMSYGIVFQDKPKLDDDISDYDFYYELINDVTDGALYDKNMLFSILEGCYNGMVASAVVEDLQHFKVEYLKRHLLIERHLPQPSLTIIDEVHFLPLKHQEMLADILSHNIKNNTDVIICSRNPMKINKVSQHTYHLKAIEESDIQENIALQVKYCPRSFISYLAKSCAKNIADVSAMIIYLRRKEIKEKYSLDYIIKVSEAGFDESFPELAFDLSDDVLIPVALISLFDYGISAEFIYRLDLPKKVLHDIFDSEYIKIYHDMLCISNKYYKTNLQMIAHKNINKIYFLLQKVIQQPEIFIEIVSLSEVYKIYRTLSDEPYDDMDMSALFQQMRTYNKSADYKKLFEIGGIAYHYVISKEKLLLCERDLEMMFLYGLSSMHCSRGRQAIEIFLWIVNHSKKDWTVYFSAKCELFNSYYQRFELNDIEAEIIITAEELLRQLSSLHNENDEKKHQLRIAYTTCQNRYMMINWLLDKKKEAEDLYIEYKKYSDQIQPSIYSAKYNSILAEWDYDYAKGLLYYDPKKSVELITDSISKLNDSINLRRVLLAKQDLAMLKCSFYGEYDKSMSIIQSITKKLFSMRIISEYFRSLIKETSCRIVHYCATPEIRKSNGFETMISGLGRRLQKEQLELQIKINGRMLMQYYSTLAAISIICNNIKEAENYLNKAKGLLNGIHSSYQEIIDHNLCHINDIATVVWCFHFTERKPNYFLLDSRLW